MTEDPRVQRAGALIAEAGERGLTLALLGGAAVATLCSSARGAGAYARTLGDIDFASTGKAKPAVDRFLLESGLEPDDEFNRINGYIRLRYFDADSSHVDVFLDELRLCHLIQWRKTLVAGAPTLPIHLLLLTKLQVVELEAKDVSDLSALLADRWIDILGDSERLLDAVRDDWGLWRTSRGTLEALTRVPDPVVADRARHLLGLWLVPRFTPRAKARSIIGDRVRWYELPEEV
ncbi:MAG: hypothetical protein JWP19_1769 [Rhodoglobus sp.]|nr:hypothetical protein [Rhodoglobus sp.]